MAFCRASASGLGVPPKPPRRPPLLLALAIVIAPAVAAASQPAHAAAETDVASCVHHFLNHRLNGIPFGVVGETELFLDVVHKELLLCAGSKLRQPPPAAAVVILRGNIAGAQEQGGGNPARCQFLIHFHRMFSSLVGLLSGRCVLPSADTCGGLGMANSPDARNVPTQKNAVFPTNGEANCAIAARLLQAPRKFCAPESKRRKDGGRPAKASLHQPGPARRQGQNDAGAFILAGNQINGCDFEEWLRIFYRRQAEEQRPLSVRCE